MVKHSVIFSSVFLFMFSICSLTLLAYDLVEFKEISGEITSFKGNSLTINNETLFLEDPSLIVYSDRYGAELLEKEDIVIGLKGTGLYNTENKVLKTLHVSGSTTDENQINLEKVMEFNEAIYDFEISSHGKYLAYYSYNNSELYIIELATGNVIWTKTISGNILYKWHPIETELTYSFTNQNVYGIVNYNPITERETPLLEAPIDFSKYINFFAWSPKGDILAYTIIEGLEDSHGFISTIYLLDPVGFIEDLGPLMNVNSISWSNDSSYLAFTQLLETKGFASQVSIYNFSKQQYFLFSKNTFNPLFTQDNSKLIYSHTDNFLEKIYSYDLNEKEKKLLLSDYRYLSDFTWLNDTTLVYTYGDDIQLKVFDIETKKTLYISNGFNPRILNGSLYFTKVENCADKKTVLYKYL